MQEEARNTEKSDDIPLKILAHNNLIGRIIGKQGSTIKKIMEETDTKITVSSINDINSYNLERIITIRGEPENISRAEAEISAKLRQAFESDINSLPVSFQVSCIDSTNCSFVTLLTLIVSGTKCHVSQLAPSCNGVTHGHGFGI